VRVLLVGTGVLPIPPTGYGGVERTIAELARALAQAGATVEVLNEVRHSRPADEYRFAIGLARKVRERAPEVVHASTPVVANRLGLSSIPYAYTSHSRHWFYRERWSHFWGYHLERRAVRYSRATVALTARVKQQILSAIGPLAPRRFPVIPIGVDGHKFLPDWNVRTGRRALGVGVVARYKRWELAARALRDTGCELSIVGPVADPAYAEELRREGPHVRILGELPEPELVRCYAESDLLLHPSSVELIAGAVVQGLSAGLPVLGAEAVADLIEPGSSGFTSREGADVVEIVRFLHEKAVELLRDPSARKAMGLAARASAERRFDWSVVARAHLELYRSSFDLG
jgi:glycosyltransferase involved in cell wall biosynthesis